MHFHRWFACFCLLSITACSTEQQAPVLLDGITMGTTYSVKITDLPNPDQQQNLHRNIKERLEAINASMSTYLPDSEISLLNKTKSDKPIPISKPFATVLEEAIRISKLSEGAFDVTVGPLVNLWGFGPEARPETTPTAEAIDAAKLYTGTGLLKLDIETKQLQKLASETYLDFSAIAKGYAVDEIADIVEKYGSQNYMVEIGGELKVKGQNQHGTNWRIAIEKPDAHIRQPLYVIEPVELAIATSGDYRNYFEQDGIRFSHTIDPRTGHPIKHNLASVTVLAPKCMTADALATAFMVMGTQQALSLAERHNIPALFLSKTQDGFEPSISSAFEPYYRHHK